jgi:hypothetical protein
MAEAAARADDVDHATPFIHPTPLTRGGPMNFLALIPTHRPLPAPTPALPPLQVLALDESEPTVRACGWFDSSWELQQGLAVAELPEAELAAVALWFADQPRAGRALAALLPALPAIDSAWLQ